MLDYRSVQWIWNNILLYYFICIADMHMVTAGVHLLGPSGCTFTPWPVPRSSSQIPYNPSPSLSLPNTPIGSIGSVAIFHNCSKIKNCNHLEMAWSLSTSSLPKQGNEFWAIQINPLSFLDFQCLLATIPISILILRCTSGTFWNILSLNPNQWYFESQNFSFWESFSFSSFQIPSLLMYRAWCTYPNRFTNPTTKLSPKLCSQHRMICFIILLHLNHRGIAFHGVTVVELNKVFF